MTIPGTILQQPIIPTGLLIHTPCIILQASGQTAMRTQAPHDTTMYSDYDLQVSTGDDRQICRQIQTLTPHNTNTNTQGEGMNSTMTTIPLPPPPYDSATSRVPTADLHHHLDTLVQENICLREESKRRLDAIQETTAAQIATLTDAVTHLTNDLYTMTNVATASVRRST